MCKYKFCLSDIDKCVGKPLNGKFHGITWKETLGACEQCVQLSEWICSERRSLVGRGLYRSLLEKWIFRCCKKINREPWRTVWAATCALAECPPPEHRWCRRPGPGRPPPAPSAELPPSSRASCGETPAALPRPRPHLLCTCSPAARSPRGLGRRPSLLPLGVLGPGRHLPSSCGMWPGCMGFFFKLPK